MKGQQGFSYTQRLCLNALWLLAAEGLALFIALQMSVWLRYFLRDSHIPLSRGFLIIPGWWFASMLFKLIPGWGLGPVEEMRRTQLLLLALFGLAATAMFLSKSADSTSRLKFSLAYLTSIPLVPCARFMAKSLLTRRKLWGLPAVIYGNDNTVRQVMKVIAHEPGLGYYVIGVFDDEMEAGQTFEGVPVLGGLKDRTNKAVVAVLGAGNISGRQLTELVEGPLFGYRFLIIIPNLLEIPSLWVNARDFLGVLGLEMVRNLLNPVSRFFKEMLEYLLVVLLMPLWLVLAGIMALLIWLEDRAHPIYTQRRIGFQGQEFTTWKFRTMVPNAEEVLRRTLEASPLLKAEWEANHKLKNDPRITRIGRFLRRSSLDELPQFFNILRGEMSLVGPRPLPAYHHQKLPQQVKDLREKVLPGLTGLWQVSGRSESGTLGMARWDAYYVRNWSIWLDIVIIVRTFGVVIRGEGAY